MVLVLVVCAPSAAQYSDRLGGNWNNPASAMITNIIMDRMARRRLERRLAAKRFGPRSGGPASSDSTEPAAKLNDAPLHFRSTGTQLKTRQIANEVKHLGQTAAMPMATLRVLTVKSGCEFRDRIDE